ncbi:MAG: tRNA lysidine(34) synthetase TilS [Proteobacteria bacterium]|jgi:tRNA(Ile)-lysidine synthase|nr:tRNA lysidine(34) synthetase TilS [Pseudomonadota bacterium]
MSFTPAQLFAQLGQLPPAKRYWIAYSGGCDSTVLLHALAELRSRLPDCTLGAVHVNHNLQEQAADWASHCRTICKSLVIPLREISVDARASSGSSPEAAARAARYAAFKQVLTAGEGLLLAQHRDDQAETLLLQLLRGAGPRGLAAMPSHRPFGAGWLGRPLLDFSRAELVQYARQAGLHWIEDPSNFDTGIERNFLRQRLWPQLQSRWPALTATLARAASHQAEAARLLQQLAAEDWQRLQPDGNQNLSIAALSTLSPERQRNLLRYWIGTIHGLAVPDQQRLKRILSEVVPARVDANPVLGWPGVVLRRYDGQLWLSDDSVPAGTRSESVLAWDLRQPLEMDAVRRLVVSPARRGLASRWRDQANVTVRFRQGGEICRPAGRAHHHPLKKLFQEWRVPPWQRGQVPLIYVDDDLAAVVGYCVCEPFQAEGEGLQVKEIRDQDTLMIETP